jgi:hypothetical protein
MSSDVAGLQPIDVQDRRMCNIDLSDIVSGECTLKTAYFFIGRLPLLNWKLHMSYKIRPVLADLSS